MLNHFNINDWNPLTTPSLINVQFSLIYRIDMSAKCFQIIIIVGSHENCPSLRLEDADNFFYIIAGLIIECIKWFVQNQYILVFHNGLCDAKLLLHTQGVMLHLCFILRIESHLLHGGTNFFIAGHTADSSQIPQILQSCIKTDKTGGVYQNTHVFRKITSFAQDLTSHTDLSAVRDQEAADKVEQDRLPTPVSPDYANSAPLSTFREMPDRTRRPEKLLLTCFNEIMGSIDYPP